MSVSLRRVLYFKSINENIVECLPSPSSLPLTCEPLPFSIPLPFSMPLVGFVVEM